MSLKINDSEVSSIVDKLSSVVDSIDKFSNDVDDFEKYCETEFDAWLREGMGGTHVRKYYNPPRLNSFVDELGNRDWDAYNNAKDAALREAKQKVAADVEMGRGAITKLRAVVTEKETNSKKYLKKIINALKKVQKLEEEFDTTTPPNFDGLAETISAASHKRLDSLYQSSLSSGDTDSNYYLRLYFEELTGGKVSGKQLYLLTNGDIGSSWFGALNRQTNRSFINSMLETGAAFVDGENGNFFWLMEGTSSGIGSVFARSLNRINDEYDEEASKTNKAMRSLFLGYVMPTINEEIENGNEINDHYTGATTFLGTIWKSIGGITGRFSDSGDELLSQLSHLPVYGGETLPENNEGNRFEEYSDYIDWAVSAGEAVASGGIVGSNLLYIYKSVGLGGNDGVYVGQDNFVSTSSSNATTAVANYKSDGSVLGTSMQSGSGNGGNGTALNIVNNGGRKDSNPSYVSYETNSGGNGKPNSLESSSSDAGNVQINSAPHKSAEGNFQTNDVIDLKKTFDANSESSFSKVVNDATNLISGKDGTPSIQLDKVDTPNVESGKSGLVGAIGLTPSVSGPSISGNINPIPSSGIDTFINPGGGLGGVNISGVTIPNVNVPNINIVDVSPSINVAGGTGINISGVDSSSVYSNVNFSTTTPSLNTIQSPNQLLDNLNSLPESIRNKISSMDLDNRAESTYYNSMSNEEFDEIKNKQITKFRSMTKEQIKEHLKKQGYNEKDSEIIANNENIGVVAFLVGEQNVTMEALRRAMSNGAEDNSEIKKPTIEELVSGEAAARLLNPYQDEEVKKASEEYEYAKEKYNRAVAKSNASSKALKVANEKLRKTRIDIEQIDGKDINKWTKEHISKYNDCVKVFVEEKEVASNDLVETINAEKELQKAMEILKEAKEKFNKKMASENASNDPSLLLLVGNKKEDDEEEEKEDKKEPFVMISKKKVMPDLQMRNLDNVEILEETGSLSSSDKAVVQENISSSVETYKDDKELVENRPAENIPKEETVGKMELNGKEIEIKKSVNNFVEAPENES